MRDLRSITGHWLALSCDGNCERDFLFPNIQGPRPTKCWGHSSANDKAKRRGLVIDHLRKFGNPYQKLNVPPVVRKFR